MNTVFNFFKILVDIFYESIETARLAEELYSMSDAELRDIGITSGDIRNILLNNFKSSR